MNSMFARNMHKAVQHASKHYTSKRGFFRVDRDLELLADSMKTFMRRGHRGCDPFNYHGQNFYYYQPVHYKPVRQQSARPAYEQKVVVYENDGSVLVKTFSKRHGRYWETYVEEYPTEQAYEQAKGNKKLNEKQNLEENKKNVENKTENTSKQNEKEQTATQQQTVETTDSKEAKSAEKDQHTHDRGLTRRHDRRQPAHYYGSDIFSQFDRHFQEVSNAITKDFDNFFGNHFDSKSLFESDRSFAESQDTSYHSKTVVNDNGNITVKTVKRNADGQWETHIERYNDKDRTLRGEQKQEAVEENKSTEQKSTDQLKQEATEPQVNANQPVN